VVDCAKLAPVDLPPPPKDNPWKKKRDEEERKRKAEEDERKRKAEEEDRRRRAEEEDRKRKAEEEERKRKAEEERKRKAEEEERKRKAEEDERKAAKRVPSLRGKPPEEERPTKKTIRRGSNAPKVVEPPPMPEEAPLPPGWTEVTDKKTGKTYYYHKATKKTSWKRPEPEPEPEEEEEIPEPEPEEDTLPPGWTEVTDKKTGKTYYYNKATKKTSWKRPTD